MTTTERFFPIGTPGTPWSEADVDAWRASRVKHRSYDEVCAAVDAIAADGVFELVDYGSLHYGDDVFVLRALKNRWVAGRPAVLVTGGVHGYETSGVWGALQFLQRDAAAFVDEVNLLVAPCVSPWGYERIQRWNYDAVDPNRSFKSPNPDPRPAQEGALVMALVEKAKREWGAEFLVHLDLHETTDTDESEFRPALAARDGKPYSPGTIPDGFYLVDDSVHPQPGFQAAIIAAVEPITHIAPADPDGTMIGTPVVAHGVIQYPVKSLGLCASVTGARFVTTTEVYPDSPRATPEQCNEAQAAAVRAGIRFALQAG